MIGASHRDQSTGRQKGCLLDSYILLREKKMLANGFSSIYNKCDAQTEFPDDAK